MNIRIVRLAVSVKRKEPHPLVYGIAILPLGTPVELEVIFEGGGVKQASNAGTHAQRSA